MKPLKLSTFALAALLLLGGCDSVRSFFGKPTSRDLRELGAQVAVPETPETSSPDTLSMPVAEATAPEPNVDRLSHRFYVIVGAFKDHSNADRLSAKLRSEKYEVTEILFKDGFKAVALYPSDNYKQALDLLNTLWDIEYLPYDLWVYDTATHIHE